MAIFLDKLENKVQIHHPYIKSFHMGKRLQKSVQYIWIYSTKYASFLGHVVPDVHKWFGCHGNLKKSENKVTIHHLHVKCFHMVKKLWKSVQYIQRYSTKYAIHVVNMQRNFHLLACPLPKLLDHLHQNFTRYTGIRGAIIFCIYKALSYSVSEWHSDKVDWSGKNADFSNLTGCHGNIPWKIKKSSMRWASTYTRLTIPKFW